MSNRKTYTNLEIKRILGANGYVIIRTKKHDIWSNNIFTFPLPTNHRKPVFDKLWRRTCKECNIDCTLK